MDNNPDNLESDDFVDKLLIDCVKPHPSLYNTDIYSAEDELKWDELQKLFGMQKSWLKKRWRTIRNDYRRTTIYNLTHSKKTPTHKMANQLNFLTIDLNGAKNMDFEDLKLPRTETFHITEEMLDGCDINESVTFDSISAPKVYRSEATVKSNEETTKRVKLDARPEYSSKNVSEENAIQKNNMQEETETAETQASKKNAGQRCEDEIFGELIVAMLKKLPPEEKKRAKKEIMNILL